MGSQVNNPWKAAGFSQRKPKVPGVYFLKTDGHLPMDPPRRLREGWDVAAVRFDVLGFGSVADAREGAGHWRLHTLSGIDRAWHAGMWLKGPLSPLEVAATPASQASADPGFGPSGDAPMGGDANG